MHICDRNPEGARFAAGTRFHKGDRSRGRGSDESKTCNKMEGARQPEGPGCCARKQNRAGSGNNSQRSLTGLRFFFLVYFYTSAFNCFIFCAYQQCFI